MSNTIYALLIGIDKYPAPINQLRGCVNDIQRVKTLLEQRINGDGKRFDVLVLTDEQAKRQAMIDGFRNHLGQAGPDDVALFYYSGHGSQEPAPPEFWPLEPDKLDETLVCWDSRLPGQWDLADKELAQLISEVANNNPHIIVILDCCHSGSGTRNLADPQDAEVVRTRRAPTDTRQRSTDTFIVTPTQAASANRALAASDNWFSLPTGRHVLLSACSAVEEAKELLLGGEPRGAFSYYLLDTLQRTGETLSYRDLFKRLNALVRCKVAQQSPQLEATALQDLDQPFLGGAIVAHTPYFTVSYDAQLGWVIDGGIVHGIPPVSGGETTELALFLFDANLDELTSLARSIGQAQVIQVAPTRSQVQLTLASGATPDPELTYKAIVTALPLPPLLVYMEGEAGGLQWVRQALSVGGPDNQPSLLVREGDQINADLRLTASDNRYQIRRTGDGYPLVVETVNFSRESAILVVQRLEHIARWAKIAELTNKTSQLPATAIRMDVLLMDDNGQETVFAAGSQFRLNYYFKDGKWRQPTFRVRLTNTSQRKLYCMLLDITETYAVSPALLPGGGVWLEPGQETWALGGQPIYASLPVVLWQQGLMEIKDMLKLIVSTDEGDATLLEQDDLPVQVMAPRAAPPLRRLSTLNRVMRRVGTRVFRADPDPNEAYTDWITYEVSSVIVRPQPTAALQKAAVTPLGSTVTVLGHPTLHAFARLTSQSEASRDLGDLALPSLLRDSPTTTPFEITASCNGAPGLSVLELVEVQNHETVTPEQPFIVQTAGLLAENEHLLPIGFDGEFYLPLGKAWRTANGTEIRLERLPAPTSGGRPSLTGSIKIFFQKVVSQYQRVDCAYARLAAAAVDDQGKVSYSQDIAKVQQKVAAARRIVLYLHGILGDTREMSASARPQHLQLPSQLPALADRYELILAFDYGNINTSLEDNARLLKQRLVDVGLRPSHGKTLHIVAHSVGGLVARWFIECEGGGQVVQHLVMLGTPNAGSPWPSVEDWATATIGIGLNNLSAMAWPLWTLGILVATIEAAAISLNQLNQNSEFLQTLAGSPDPAIPYSVIVGNAAIIATALQPQASEQQSRFARLWPKIKPKQWWYAASDLAFFNAANDIAVSVESSQSVPDARSPQPKIVDVVTCDHFTYFSTAAGLQALAEALP